MHFLEFPEMVNAESEIVSWKQFGSTFDWPRNIQGKQAHWPIAATTPRPSKLPLCSATKPSSDQIVYLTRGKRAHRTRKSQTALISGPSTMSSAMSSAVSSAMPARRIMHRDNSHREPQPPVGGVDPTYFRQLTCRQIILPLFSPGCR